MLNFRLLSGFVIVLLALFMIQCKGPSRQQHSLDKLNFQQQIAQSEKNVLLSNGTIIKDSAEKLIDRYQAYQQNWPNDSISSDYLFKAIDLSMNLPRTNETLKLISAYLKSYPESYQAGVAMFLEGFIYDQEIGDTARARLSYEQLINTYPEHDFADDAKNALNFLGKSPEELIQSFERQNK
ncbi:MAG: tetratricopeptide repeat protein [Bacteroidales bacterium]|jgi:outer membrane protein assembly factor BamD (BamD/ComL family)|nr:tetratricopeptide repeat protein [Bacteroidales bacterium]